MKFSYIVIVNKREQHYIDTLYPEYNVLKTAYSSLGYKHTPESLEKVRSNIKKFK